MNETLGGLALSLAAYLIGMRVHRAGGMRPYLHPVVIAMLLIVAVLATARSLGFDRVDAYTRSNALLLDMLMVGVVAFALPLFDSIGMVVKEALRLLAVVAMSCGALAATTTLIALAAQLNPQEALALSLRTVTNPIAVAIADQNDLLTDVALLGIFITGLVGVASAEWVLRPLGVSDPRRVGLVLGITSHTFGIARALEIDKLAAAYATVGMILTGVVYAFGLPWAIRWISG